MAKSKFTHFMELRDLIETYRILTDCEFEGNIELENDVYDVRDLLVNEIEKKAIEIKGK